MEQERRKTGTNRLKKIPAKYSLKDKKTVLHNDVKHKEQTTTDMETTKKSNTLLHENEIDVRSRKYIRCWDVRKMTTTRKAKQIGVEMERYGIEIQGLSEIKWKGIGEIELENGIKLIYSGKIEENAKHDYCGTFMISRNSKNSITEWSAISERIIVVRFRGRFYNICIINIYAPTNENERKKKKNITKNFKKCMMNHEKNTKDIFIMMRDMTAKIGGDNRGREKILAIKTLKNGKAAGIDGVLSEILKEGETVTVNMMHHQINKIWNEGTIPTECNKGLIIRLPKKETKLSMNIGEE
ncbi:hypothetical protein CBL_12095 [Carabus blaptoides fortunei]